MPSSVPAHTPHDRPAIAVAADGTLAAILEPTRVVTLALPAPDARSEVVSEVGIDAGADGYDAVWVGTPPRLLVLSRYAGHSTVHLIDPHGPRTIAEVHLPSAMRLYAVVGAHALAIGAQGAAILTAGDAHLAPYQFPTRARPSVAGAAGTQFVAALPGAIEEWDPQSRMPRRRLRLPRPAAITAVGGSERVVWLVTQQAPARVDVLPLINRGQPKSHELPEPIAAVAGHPRSDLLVCLGADTGRLYAIDLDGRTQLRVLAPPGLDRVDAAGLVVGRTVAVLAAQAGRPIVLMPLDPRDSEHAPAPAAMPSSIPAPRVSVPIASSGSGAIDEPSARPSTLFGSVAPDPAPPPVLEDVAAVIGAIRTNFSERFAAVRERHAAVHAGRQADATAEPDAAAPASSSTWREACAAWASAVLGGASTGGAAAPVAPELDDLARRVELPAALVPAVVLLYGAHLAGEHGVAPVVVARVLGGQWDEALGRGRLAACGVATLERSRLTLVPAIERALDACA